MAEWVKQYPVAFTPGGDKTYQAIEKHMNELSRIYAILNRLRTMDTAATAPADPAPGALWMDDAAATPRIKRFDGTAWRSVMDESPAEGITPIAGANGLLHTGFTFPPGTILMFGGGKPDGFLACNGLEISRTAYAALFDVIGTTYGEGNGVSTFNIPDFRGRFPVCTGQGPGLTEKAMGQTGGEEGHILSSTEVPPTDITSIGSQRLGSGWSGPNIDTQHPMDTYQGSAAQPYHVDGGGQPHNNMPPYLSVNFIIKY